MKPKTTTAMRETNHQSSSLSCVISKLKITDQYPDRIQKAASELQSLLSVRTPVGKRETHNLVDKANRQGIRETLSSKNSNKPWTVYHKSDIEQT